jgi:hypothetical protein
MKKTGLLLVTLVFVAGLGTAYAADFNGVTDFSGRSHDYFEITTPGPDAADRGYESSAPGSKRLIEDLNTTGKSHDMFEIGDQGTAKHNMKQNWGGKKPSGNSYDYFEISR